MLVYQECNIYLCLDSQDGRPDVGNYDLDDAFIDDSEVKEFYDGLLKRKPKYHGFCIVKV